MHRARTLRRTALIAATLALLRPSAHAADPQPYTVTIAPTGDAAIDGALKDSSSLNSLRTSAPVGPFALVTRAQSDIGRLQTALQSFGYYDSHVAMQIEGRSLDDPGLPDLLAALPKGQTAKVTASVQRGPLFHLRNVTIDGTIPASARAKLGIASGDPAVASNVLAGQSNLLTALQVQGYALAKVSAPDAVETPGQRVLDITFHVQTGPRVDIGAIDVNGLKVTNPGYVRNRLLVHSGQQYDPTKIEAARQDLSATGIFSAVNATVPDHLAPDGTIPLTFTVTERPRHAVAFNVAYSTDMGATAGATFTYRNVFGNDETLTLGAALTQAETGALVTGPGYNLNATLAEPDWFARNQTLTETASYVKENLYAYSRKAELGGVTLSRQLAPEWKASIGLTGVQERVEQEFITRNYTLAAIPLGLTYDSTGPGGLFEPTHGIKAALTVTPTDSLAGHSAFFTLVKATASTYINLGAKEGRSILALRGTIGSALGASTFGLPPDQRFYAGGSDTVRGYNYQGVGPLFADNRPIGGTSLTAGTIEFRQRFGESFGAVAFVDTGEVGSSSAPFTGTLSTGVGVGARYYTSLGPIRFDIAVPLEKKPKDQIVQAYIGLGEAF